MAEPLFVQDPKLQSRLEIKRYGYALRFDVSPDGVECFCTYEPATTGGMPMTEADLQGFLAQFKITEGVLPEGVSGLLKSAATGQAVEDFLIARGTPMVPGEDGEMVIAVADAMASDEDAETGCIDLHKVQSFLNVDTDQLIAIIRPPGEGTPGRSVFAKEIPAQPGTPFPLKLGLHVRRDDNNLYAEAAGRVCVRGEEISVEDIYEIDGDVDFNVGNIVFKGFVEIKGDVLDGFSVKSTGGIKVHGIIGVCDIQSDGDIFFSGVNGRGTGTIVCGGSITANYIYETIIECAGNLIADVEIRNSTVRTLGSITVNRRGISGGEYFALAGVDSFFLGNVVSLHTSVVAGVHYRDLEELNQLFSELKQVIADFGKSSKEKEDLQDFAAKKAAITKKIQDVRERSYPGRNAKVNVRKVLYEGVAITLGSLTETIKEAKNGPLSIIENTIEGGFRYLGMTPLSFNATDIEKTFVHAHELELKKAAQGEGL